MDLYRRVRRAHFVEGISVREVARMFDLRRNTVNKMLEYSAKKQRHTAKRIFERLKEEHGFSGKYTIVKDYVRQRRTSTWEMFVPLLHPPGHGQADFGEA